MKIMMSAGEASGDLHGAHLIDEIRKLVPDASFLGMGGEKMGASGMDIVFDPTKIGAFGLFEIIKLIPLANNVRRKLIDRMRKERPDVLVLIDYPGFNMRLAKEAKKAGIKCAYYFSPSAWAWKEGRAYEIAKSVNKVISVFTFEEAVYKKAGADVIFVGHPLKDMVQRHKTNPNLMSELHMDSAVPILALCPGSRRKEISGLFPIMVAAAIKLKEKYPDLQIVCPVAVTVKEDELMSVIDGKLNVTFYHGSIYDIFRVASLAFIASGTATLEAALCYCPMVIVYKVSNLTYQVFKRLVRIKHVGLPNIVSGDEVVPELLQTDLTIDNLYKQGAILLEDEEARVKLKCALKRVDEKLGPYGAIGKAAQVIVDLAGEI